MTGNISNILLRPQIATAIFSFAFYLVWVGSTLNFVFTENFTLRICAFLLAFGGAFGHNWFKNKYDKVKAANELPTVPLMSRKGNIRINLGIWAFALFLCLFPSFRNSAWAALISSMALGAIAAIWLEKE